MTKHFIIYNKLISYIVSARKLAILESLTKNVKDKVYTDKSGAFEVLETKEFTFVNDCFKYENIAVQRGAKS